MHKVRLLVAACCGLFMSYCGSSPQSAEAGTWTLTFFPEQLKPITDFGAAARTTDATGYGHNYISFPGDAISGAVVEFNIPSFLTNPEMTCTFYGRTSSTTTTNIFRLGMETLTTTGSTLWQTNDGVGLTAYALTAPSAVSNGTITAVANPVLFTDDTTNVQCVSVGACQGKPTRFAIARDTTVGSNDPAAIELIKIVCTATTN